MSAKRLLPHEKPYSPGNNYEVDVSSLVLDQVARNARNELERLRPLLETYDPQDEPIQYYRPPRNKTVLVAKFLGYSCLGALTIGMGVMVLRVFNFISGFGGC